jgi:hypothetical protein
MGNAYKVGKYRLTAMQMATYESLKEKKGKAQSIEQIVQGLYEGCISGRTPDIWTHEEKTNNVIKWCKTLVHLKLIESGSDGKFNF